MLGSMQVPLIIFFFSLVPFRPIPNNPYDENAVSWCFSAPPELRRENSP